MVMFLNYILNPFSNRNNRLLGFDSLFVPPTITFDRVSVIPLPGEIFINIKISTNKETRRYI